MYSTQFTNIFMQFPIPWAMYNACTQNFSYIYGREVFCVRVRKTLPIYIGILLRIGVHNFNMVTPIYKGEVLHRGLQYLSYIYGSENLISVMLIVRQYYIQGSRRFGDFGPKLSPQNQLDIYFLALLIGSIGQAQPSPKISSDQSQTLPLNSYEILI